MFRQSNVQGADLIAGSLNIEGKQVDACINNGTDCGLPAADAFCKYIGFDGANPDMEQIAPADEPVRAVTGVCSMMSAGSITVVPVSEENYVYIHVYICLACIVL